MIEVEKKGPKIVLRGRTRELDDLRRNVCDGCPLSSLGFVYGDGKAECLPRWKKNEIAACLKYT